MTFDDLELDLRHEERLCYAMQQAAVPWLLGIELHWPGAEALPEFAVSIVLSGYSDAHRMHVEGMPAGQRLALDVPDLSLHADAFAGLVERARADLVVEFEVDGEIVRREVRPVDVLAYNEWPGLPSMPALLAAFVLPNHPALSPVLQAAAHRLEQATGDGSFDGYKRGSVARVQAMVAAVHDAVCAVGIRYVTAPPSFEQGGQKVRTPEQVVGERFATCLDLSLLYAALFEQVGLQPFVVVLREHAFVGVHLQPDSRDAVEFGSAVELRKAVTSEAMAVVETTVACVVPPPGRDRAQAAAMRRFEAEAQFVNAIDIAAARRIGVRPLPVRTSVYEPQVGELPPEQAHADDRSIEDAVIEEAARPRSSGPRDRLEHWQNKLLDLSMFNRLLNFVETKKTVRLSAHLLADIEDRLQAGARMRLLGKPEVGAGQDPRDLELAASRSGTDLLADYLADELRAGRWRCELDDDQLQVRLTEIFRHARTSVEESGANTLYLAVGFLRWFESDDSSKPRRAPLLLVPLVIERLSVQEGYRFVMDDAEVRLNTTLLQMLERDFDLHLPIGDSLPEDERGVDVDAVLDLFRKVALQVPRWEVENVACVGFFSFTKFLMWRDLKNRDELLQSPVLQHLIDNPGAALEQDVPEFARDELDDLEPREVFCPLDADSSQLAAVIAGAGGRSFVLEGPPGTGKSQTITNLIAQSLANGKRVLFVAEKRAALQVVHRRLADVGLAPFCLELHSQKSGPKAVLEQLRDTLELGHRRAPEQWQQVADDLQQQRTQLNDFVNSLHRRREHGWSVYDAMVRLLGLRDARRESLPELLAEKPEVVASAREAIEELAVVSGTFGVPSEHPWWGVQRGDWTPAVTRDVVPMARRLQDTSAALARAMQPLLDAFGWSELGDRPGPSRDQLQALLELVRLLQSPSLPPASWLTSANWRQFAEDLERAVAIGRRRDDLWSKLEPRWRRDLLALDLGSLAASYRLHAESFVLFRWLRLRGHKATLASAASGTLGSATSIRDDLELALRCRDEEQELQNCRVAADGVGIGWRDGLANWTELEQSLRSVRELRQLVLRLVPGSLQPEPVVMTALASYLEGAADGVNPLAEACGELFAAHDAWQAALRPVLEFLELSPELAFGDDEQPDHVARVGERAAGWLANEARLRDQCAYRRAAVAAEHAHLTVLIDAHARGELAAHELLPAFERSLLEGWLDGIHSREPELARFRGSDHEAGIARFAALDEQAIQLGAKIVVARLAARLPRLRDTNVSSSELGVLERELKKQRRHKPVRRLLSEIRGLWPRLSPCVLMSPLSVAQFLDRDAQRFDLVVFDEASQIPMWDAVGAIGRGESLIVVGDSRQLPPTSFFQRMSEGDERESHEIPEDLESVLDECGAAGLPRMHLDWHYRSRHESLIAFSNHHYYQNRLLTFPSPHAAGEGEGVSCVRVDGIYDRAGTQQNRIEAEALVQSVVARLRDPGQAQRSIGIVTFSRAQQALIEDLLDAERRADPTLEAAIAACDEELFVKNLENVQGDERDVILFSICYGPDAAGKIYENYGPLNLPGGERRLNVAVTRARRELVVFSSVSPEQVANRTEATGARHLRSFLDYAMRGEVALVAAIERDPSRGVDSPFEASVRDALVQRGHEVHTQVGCSGYRIDLGIVDPASPGGYLLGVECDGATYHRAATARDRDRLRASVLRGLGWQLLRVWSTDYWQDPVGVLERLEEEIEAARTRRAAAAAAAAEPETTELEVPTDDAAVAEPSSSDGASAEQQGEEPEPEQDPEPELLLEPPPDPDGPRDYGYASELAGEDASRVVAVLQLEGPVTFALLVRRLANSWNVARISDRVRDRVRAALPDVAIEEDNFLWADADQRSDFRGFRVPEGDDSRRDLDEVPLVELVNSMAWLLRQHHALAADDLMRETARCFGVTRLGSNVRDLMEGALEQLIEQGRGTRDENNVSLPEPGTA